MKKRTLTLADHERIGAALTAIDAGYDEILAVCRDTMAVSVQSRIMREKMRVRSKTAWIFRSLLEAERNPDGSWKYDLRGNPYASPGP